MANQITFDVSSNDDQSIWSAFNPLTLELVSAPSREEFERLYLCRWERDDD